MLGLAGLAQDARSPGGGQGHHGVGSDHPHVSIPAALGDGAGLLRGELAGQGRGAGSAVEVLVHVRGADLEPESRGAEQLMPTGRGGGQDDRRGRVGVHWG